MFVRGTSTLTGKQLLDHIISFQDFKNHQNQSFFGILVVVPLVAYLSLKMNLYRQYSP